MKIPVSAEDVLLAILSYLVQVCCIRTIVFVVNTIAKDTSVYALCNAHDIIEPYDFFTRFSIVLCCIMISNMTKRTSKSEQSL